MRILEKDSHCGLSTSPLKSFLKLLGTITSLQVLLDFYLRTLSQIPKRITKEPQELVQSKRLE